MVDDDLLTRKLMSRMLTRLGCEVSTAENGQVALDMLLRPEVAGEVREAGTGRGNYDVCYLDNQVRLPFSDIAFCEGWELIRSFLGGRCHW